MCKNVSSYLGYLGQTLGLQLGLLGLFGLLGSNPLLELLGLLGSAHCQDTPGACFASLLWDQQCAGVWPSLGGRPRRAA
eukprot:8760935-Pyramimonas_sp.AAC.1